MGFFWFIVAVVLLVVWLSERSDLKKHADKAFSDGYSQGYWAFHERVKMLVDNGKLSKRAAAELVGDQTEPATTTKPAEYSPDQDASVVLVDNPAVIIQTESIAQPQPFVALTPPPALTDKELAEAKERRTLQNLNAMLYVGSFLIVAAAAVFVTLTMPATVKLLGLVTVTIAFYTTGLVLYEKSSRLRPAAIAFVGTGLAILPFVGFALTSLGGLSGSIAWFITSAVGLIAYGVAAVRLQSQLVSYLTIAFVLSLALSAVAAVSLAIVWYFIVVIGVSVLFNSIHYLRPQLLPNIFWQPVEQTGMLITPVALVASLLTFERMNVVMYEVLFGVATAHYLVVWLEKRAIIYEIAIRVLAHITALIVAYDVAGGLASEQQRVALNLVWSGLLVLQVVYSFVRERWQKPHVESAYVGIALAMIVWGMLGWVGVDHASRGVALDILLAGLISLGAAIRFRKTGWLYGTLAASILLPFVIGRLVVEPAANFEVIAVLFAMCGALAVFGLERVKATGRSTGTITFVATAVFTYAASLLLAGWSSASMATLGWTLLVAAGMLVIASYLLASTVIEVIASVLLVGSVASWVNWIEVEADWQLLVTVVVSAALLIGGAYTHHTYGERKRRDSLLVVAACVMTLLVAVTTLNNVVVARTTTVLLLAASAAMLALRVIVQSRASMLAGLGMCGYAGYPVIALAVAAGAGMGWLTLVLGVATAIAWVSSRIEKAPLMLAVGNVAFICGLNTLWSWLQFDEDWRLFGVTWLAAATFYASYWYFIELKDRARQSVSFISTLLLLGFASLAGFLNLETVWAMSAAGSLLAGSVIVAVHGYLEKRRDLVELSVYSATLALQRMAGVLLPELNMVAYGHWWALTIAYMAVQRHDARTRLIVALSFVTASTGLYALGGESGYDMLFLVEHLAVLVAGAMLRKQWLMWWGIVSSVLAVLYFLRNYTALALLFLGFVIILIVIWRLLLVGKKNN